MGNVVNLYATNNYIDGPNSLMAVQTKETTELLQARDDLNKKIAESKSIDVAVVHIHQLNNNNQVVQNKVNDWVDKKYSNVTKEVNDQIDEIFAVENLTDNEKNDAYNACVKRNIVVIAAIATIFAAAALIALAGCITGGMFFGALGSAAIPFAIKALYGGLLTALPAIPLYTLFTTPSLLLLKFMNHPGRVDTAYNDAKFHEFYNTYCNGRIKKKDIADKELHKIFNEWKTYSEPIKTKLEQLDPNIRATAEERSKQIPEVKGNGNYIINGLRIPRKVTVVEALTAI